MKKKITRFSVLLSFVLLFTQLSAQRTVVEPYYALLFSTGTTTPSPNFDELKIQNLVDNSEVVNGKYYRIIQFYTIPTNSQKANLENLGIEFLEYMPKRAYIVAIPSQLAMLSLDGYNIRGIFKVIADQKINPTIANNSYPDHAMIEPGKLDLIVNVHKNVDLISAADLMQGAGLEILKTKTSASTIYLRARINDIEDIANIPFVHYVEPIGDPGEPEDEWGRSLHRANILDADYGAGKHITGDGVHVTLMDDGYVGEHIDFKNRTEQSQVANDMNGTHGDMTGGIISSAGNLNPRYRGMAVGSFMHVRQYDSDMPDIDSLHTNEGCVIWSTSYSNGCNAGYTQVARDLDLTVNQHESVLMVFSAGNSNNQNCSYGAGNQWGNITGGHKIAKSVIATANLLYTDALVASSSRGPAHDGRIKPDISANGNGQMSNSPGNTYATGGGTSAACPGIAGVSAQLYEAYRDLNGGTNPPSSLIKASIMNTADELGNVGPDFKFGWGRINGANALSIMEDGRYFSDTVSQGNMNNHQIQIPANVKQARIMVYWLDPAAAVSVSRALINDLNITVTDPAAGTNSPYLLDHTPNPVNLDLPATTGVDSMNNVEQVSIMNPAVGNYVLHVNGTSVPMGPQEYYVVYHFDFDSLKVIYPTGGEGISPGDTLIIRWDAFDNTGTFTIDYSSDNGGVWINLTSGFNNAARNFDWITPNSQVEDGRMLMRVARGSQTAISTVNWSFMEHPTGLNIDYVCPDSIKLSWNAQGNATSYDVFMLGNEYMDSVANTTNNFYVFGGLVPTQDHWFSVVAHGPNGARSRRANAINQTGGVTNCPLPLDAGVTEVSPNGELYDCFASANSNVVIEIVNDGTTAISNIPVHYSINGGTAINEIYALSIGAGGSATYTFTQQANLGTVGSYNIASWASLASDGNSYNDTTFALLNIITGTMITLPYAQNFETFNLCTETINCEVEVCPLIAGWRNQGNGEVDDIDWRVDEDGTPSNGTGPGTDHDPGSTSGNYLYLESSGGCNFMEAYMVSPCIDLSGQSAIELSFWFHMRGSDQGDLHIDIFHGGSWNNDVTFAMSGDWGNVWNERIVDLSAYAGDTIQIRFRGVTGDGFRSDLAIDDINIYPLVGVDVELTNSFSMDVYPNPTEGILNIHAEGLKTSDVKIEIYNLLMLPVYNSESNLGSSDFDEKVDLSDLSRGIYFIRLSNGEESRVVKFELL